LRPGNNIARENTAKQKGYRLNTIPLTMPIFHAAHRFAWNDFYAARNEEKSGSCIFIRRASITK